nr:Ycf38 [Erythrotrichia longistipitata]
MLSSSTKTVLTPIQRASFSSFKFNHLIQEIKALFRRLVLQSCRRSSFLVAGLVQPLLWLVLFGSLFQKSTFPVFSNKIIYYDDFLGSGIVVFTAFTSSLNAGLPIMFDREFGFFNRLLVVPITSRLSIVIASFYHIVSITAFQMFTISIITVMKNKTHISIGFNELIYGTFILLLLICLVTVISIVLAFILSGHIELLALILLINLPILFSSTALAPLTFMPAWLRIIAMINPLTYAIESLRHIMIFDHFVPDQKTISTVFGILSVLDIVLYFSILNICTFFLANRFFQKKLE